jgi:3-oxoacyl-[acyl-carrier protein] reductase
MELGLRGKVAIVTGGGRGIGKAIAESLAAEGATVAVVTLHEETARSAAASIESRGGKAVGFGLSVSDEEQVQKMVAAVLDRYGQVDVLVNNAGINSKVSTRELAMEWWKMTLDTNLTGAFVCSRAVMELMAGQRSGRIVNISSINAFQPWTSDVAYVTTKAGIIGLTRKLAKDLAPYGVTCNALAPSRVLNEMNRAAAESMSREELLTPFPLGRLCEPGDVANSVLFLASDTASFITGQVLHINGGAYM